MNLQVLMFKPEQPKIQMYMSYINPCSLYLCYTKLIFFSPWYSTNCYKTILLLMLFLLTITAQQTDQVYMKGSLYSTLKGISIYFITEWIFCIPDESWLQNSWSFVQPLLVSFHKITWASKHKCYLSDTQSQTLLSYCNP